MDYRLSPASNTEHPPKTVLGEWLELQKIAGNVVFRPFHPIQQAELEELRRLWGG